MRTQWHLTAILFAWGGLLPAQTSFAGLESRAAAPPPAIADRDPIVLPSMCTERQVDIDHLRERIGFLRDFGRTLVVRRAPSRE